MFDIKDGNIFALPSCADSFFSKYLSVFDSVYVLGEKIKNYLNKNSLVRIQNPNIHVKILPSNTRIKDFKNDIFLKKELTQQIKHADAILIKPASRRGMMAIKLAKKFKKPYMIEMTGDIHNALKQSSSLIRKIYSTVLFKQIKKSIADCEYGIYVSREYLQKKYPIQGKTCGCSDVILEMSDMNLLNKRILKIDNMNSNDIINLALIGFYQGNGKGVDTALRAMARLPENFHLSVLGNGTEESRQRWYAYGKKYGVCETRLHFPAPLPSTKDVLHWLDDVDFFVLPSRSEGFGRVIAEAMSRGLPCFATNICTIPELLPQSCLFELDDDKKLAELIISYTNNKALMKEAATINFENAKVFDAELLKKRRDAFLNEFKEYCKDMRNQTEQ